MGRRPRSPPLTQGRSGGDGPRGQPCPDSPGCLPPECSRATLLLVVETGFGSLRGPVQLNSWVEVLGSRL